MTLLFLFIIGLCAGTVDAMAGGGGLISLPILLGLGLPTPVAFATNKLQGVVGTLVATLKYYRHGYIDLKTVYPCIFMGLIGSILGVFTVEVMNGELLRHIIPIILTLILIYSMYTPRMGQNDDLPKVNKLLFYLLSGFCLGFYDGFFGPGTGSLWVFALVFFLGFNLLKATAYTKVFNLNSSLAASICFAMGGYIDYQIVIVMAAGQLIGGRLGAHLAITNGARLIRPIFASVVSVTILTLVYKNYVVPLGVAHARQFDLTSLMLMACTVVLSLVLLYVKVIQKQKNEVTS